MAGITPFLPGTGAMSGTVNGTASFVGDSFTDTFVITHNLGKTPDYADVVPINFNAIGDYSVVVDSTSIIFQYSYPPEIGPLEYTWMATI